MVLERESPPRSPIVEGPFTCLSLATCRPNSFGHWGGGLFFSKLWTDIQTLVFSERPHSPLVYVQPGNLRRLQVVTHPGRASVFTPFSISTTVSAGRSTRLEHPLRPLSQLRISLLFS